MTRTEQAEKPVRRYGLAGGLMSSRADDSVRDVQQPPSEQPKPEEPRQACSSHRRAVTDQAERNAHSHETTGTTRSVGSQRSRHRGSRRNANASNSGTTKKSADATPDSKWCPSACQDVFSQPSSMPRQSSRRKPSRNRVTPITASPRTPSLASQPDPSARQRPNAKATIRTH